jgi:hypothetical protein
VRPVEEGLLAKRAFVQAVATGAVGYIFVLVLKALGRREIAGLVRLLCIALCLVAMVKVAFAVIESVAAFFEPLNKFLAKLTEDESLWVKFWDFVTRMPREGK